MNPSASHEYRLLPEPPAAAAPDPGDAPRGSAGGLGGPSGAVGARSGETPAVDPDVVASLFQRGTLALVGHAVGGLAVMAFYASKAPPRTLALWAGVFVLGWLVRAGVIARYRRARPLTPPALARAHRHWEMTTVASGVVWGLAVAMLFPYGDNLHRLGLVLAVVSYCLASPATSYAVFLLYAAACFLPLVVHLAFSEEAYSEALAGGMTLVFLSTLLVARQDQRMFQRLHDLKRRDAQLVRQLAAERNAAQAAHEQAEAAHRAKSRFFSAASHDLRQPLHAMALFTRSLMHHPLEPPAMRLVTSIDEAIYAMERLFDQILDLDRIDSGGLALRPQPVLLEDVFRRVRVHVEAVAFDKGLALTFRGGQHQVWADPLLLERVLRNLVANAIRYTEDGGVLVACRLAGEGRILQVWDTGIGIAPDALPRVFDEFYQHDAAQRPETGEYRGLGLGLAIVRRLLDLMQVPLSVRTRAGFGSVFTLSLPAVGGMAAHDGDARNGVVTDRSAGRPGGAPAQDAESDPSDRRWRERLTLAGRLILVIESDEAEAQRVARLLRSWSAEVRVLGDVAALERWWPAQALQARERLPDLLIAGDQVREAEAASESAAEGGEAVGASGAALRPGSRVVAWLRAATAREIPAVLLVPAGQGEHEPGAIADPLALDGGLHRLERPVQANRLRALVAFKLNAPGAAGRPH